MAERSGAHQSEGLETQLRSLLSGHSGGDDSRVDGEPFCSDFRKLVEEHASRWQVPLPQLRILEIALCYFARASAFTSNCDHVLHTLSSLALSVFELLLFFDQRDFNQEPLKTFTVTFQECHLALAKHQNVHLLQVERLVRGGGPWASPALQAILSDSSLPQNEVDGCISSELPVFFELRVRYLLSCERVSEALALAACCARHPTAGQHLFFLQVYLTWLYKTSQHDRLHKEVADVNGDVAVHIICSLECEEKDELLLALSTAFLSQQLRRGDMYYLCDLVFVWSKLHSRLKTPKQALLEESRQLMLSAANVTSIFPFIRATLQEVGEDGLQFCVELCANALQSCLPCDVITKSLIYKTIASLLPNDLEVCRACALLVFFLERTVESYKMVYILYMHPDQEYHVDHSPIANHIRFETLQVLKKDLYFDPEFWNLIALRTNCLKLMSEKVVSAALEEIMEDKWISNYCSKKPALQSRASLCKKGSKSALQAAAKKRHHKDERDTASKRLKVGPGKTRLRVDHDVKKKGNQVKEGSSQPLRRSFWQLDRMQDKGHGEHRRTTRLSEKNMPKRRIKKPKWLLEDAGALEKNKGPLKIKKHGFSHEKHDQSSVLKRSETLQIKNDAKHKPSGNWDLKVKDDNSEKGFSLDSLKPASTPQVILELSLPDNELMGTFTEDSCNRHRGLPQVLLYKRTVKLPATSQPVKTVHRKEVVVRARGEAMFVQLLHCYARRPKGKGNGPNAHRSVSTITRSSVQGSSPKDPQREVYETPATEMKDPTSPRTTAEAKNTESTVLENVPEAQTTKAASRKIYSASELSEKSAVEMKVTVASQRPAADKLTGSPVLHKTPQTEGTRKISQSITIARDLPGRSAAEMEVAAASKTSAAGELTVGTHLGQVPQAAGELCEEPAVEMKVTIASQSPVLDKVSKAVTVGDVAKAETDKNPGKVADESPPVSHKANVSNTDAADGSSQSQHVPLRGEKQELRPRSSQAESVKTSISVSSTSIQMDATKVCPKDSTVHVPWKNDTTEARYPPTDPCGAADGDLSALTLVTEMVTDLAPEQLARDLENDKQRAPGNSAAKESRDASKPHVPHKIQTTSSCSVPQLEDSVIDVKAPERTQDESSDTSENSEFMDPQPESEESKLDFCCTFCNKDFKGSRVVAHAMFHYRKDECMFCRTIFKDDLLAMMHLSDHIEKLKRSKDSAGNKSPENGASETKDIATPKTSAKAKTTNMSSGCRGRGRPKKSTVFLKLMSPTDSNASESRRLRSKDKPVNSPSQEKQSTSKHLHSKTTVHNVNGHFGKKKEFNKSKKDFEAKQTLQVPRERTSDGAVNPRLQENRDTEMDSSSTSVKVVREDKMKVSESLQVLKTAAKQNRKIVEEKNVEPPEKLCCPLDGCSWFTDLSKNRVALLYHALEDHYGEVEPLELAFRVGNGKCSICMRVLWSFEHFQHHVERHRLTPRHPCLHQGCTARFKSGMEMRHHTRKHSPLQAVCCLPGCSKLFICLWALNLHEREHYASKSTKPDKNTSVPTDEKHSDTLAERTQRDPSSDDTAAVTTSEGEKAACSLTEQATHDSPTTEHVKAPRLSAGKASLIIQKLRERIENKELNVLKNLSNKDTSAQPAVPNLRLRQTLRKGQITNTTVAAAKISTVITSSLSKHRSKVSHRLKKKQVRGKTKGPERRGRPPKSNKVTYDENTTAGQNSETGKERLAVQTDQKSPAQLSSPETLEIATASNKLKVKEGKISQVQDGAETTDASKSKKSAGKQIKRNHFKLKGISRKNHSASSHSKLKKHKIANIKVKKHGPARDPNVSSAGKRAEESRSAEPQAEAKAAAAALESCADDEGKTQLENPASTQSGSGNSVPAHNLNAPPTPEKTTQKVKRKEKQSHGTKEGKHATSKSNQKPKDRNEKGDKKSVKEKGTSKTSALCKVQQEEASGASGKRSPDEEGKGEEEQEEKEEEEASDATVTPAATNIFNERTCPPTGNTHKVTKKERSKKNSDPSKANKKRKDVHRDDDAKIVKKRCKDRSGPSTPKKPETSAAKAEASTTGVADRSLITNGQASNEEVKSSMRDTLIEYSKKPYMRLPPTAYLDEKYITMPKRRKEVSFLQPSQRSPPPEQASAAAAAALQRQRCANCFASFASGEELQSHLQQQKCSNIFGFDSDDEGNNDKLN
ncbi:titin homolog [Brachyistius frenatus]|uniref:titin homolog n=1 Tax=Brachyistius frenatus TaxID=100188 RepID=UPI0037E9C43F